MDDATKRFIADQVESIAGPLHQLAGGSKGTRGVEQLAMEIRSFMEQKNVRELGELFAELCNSMRLISGGSDGNTGFMAVAGAILPAGEKVKEGLDAVSSSLDELSSNVSSVSSSIDEHAAAMNNVAEALREIAQAIRNK